MTYYEELGLKADATADEIRQAYRSLARLLHPDQQADEALKQLAESQMKRLNSIYEALTDPTRRRQYDASLSLAPAAGNRATGPRPPAQRFVSIRDAGLLVAGATLASLFWLLPGPPANKPGATPARSPDAQPLPRTADDKRERAPMQSAKLAAELAEMRRQLEAARAERDAALARPAKPPPVIDWVVQPAGGDLEPLPPRAAASTIPPVGSPDRIAAADTTRFGGTWMYARPRVPQTRQSLYPAEYVEAVIVEEAGALRGRYRARYQVADRPISSEVMFRFEGRPEGETASLSWTGAGGAKGQLKLRLLSPDSMELSWIATELGSQMGLASGTAILTRRHEP